ncbi:transposase [Fusarium oxysporum f. sp. phaseoli]
MPQQSYTENDVIEAMLDVTVNHLSQHQAAQKHGMPQTTLSDRLRGLPSKSEVIQPAQLLYKSQESRLVTWILRQEALGYAPSHSQVRATVAAPLRQQGRERPIGVHWLARFIKRHPEIDTKVGKRPEASRFNSFTPMAVNWYFDIWESEYGWIKPENTVDVDEGGIMAGFGLDSLVIGSSDPRRKAFLKGSQSRTWTSFIEAVTADGRLLKPGIIFKGKELQKQWFIDEFNKIADWYYITSDNGWTDNHIAVEWLKEVYLPQTQPADESDARLIILDGHGSHVSDEWMATCFLNNVYCCYLPAHCSHDLQPLDNGVFNASKAAYRKELQKLASLTDSALVDKTNFIKAYAKAREVGMTKKNILSGWRVTGNWPISRRKALMHPEIQPDKKETTPGSDGHRDGQVDSDNTPKTSRHIRDLGKNKSPSTRRRYSVISKGFEAQESKIASLSTRIASLEEEVGRLSRGKKRKAIPNPNKKFISLAEALAAGDTISEPNEAIEGADVVEDVIEVGGIEKDERSNSGKEELGVVRTRTGREVKRPRKY